MTPLPRYNRKRALAKSLRMSAMGKASQRVQAEKRITLENPDGRKTGSHGCLWILDHLRPYLAGRK